MRVVVRALLATRPHAAKVTIDELRAALVDNGIWVQDVEAAGDWLGIPPATGIPWLQPVYTTDELLDFAEKLDARTLVLVHFGEPTSVDHAADAFAGVCDRAADRGRQVALEFPAFATISDVRTAWRIVEQADRPNGGLVLDSWHHRRSGADDAALDAVPVDRFYSVQLSDGAPEPTGRLIDDVMERSLPGTGGLRVTDLLRGLIARGLKGPIGIEVLRREISQTVRRRRRHGPPTHCEASCWKRSDRAATDVDWPRTGRPSRSVSRRRIYELSAGRSGSRSARVR